MPGARLDASISAIVCDGSMEVGLIRPIKTPSRLTSNLVWGVKAFYYNKRISTDHTIADIKYLMKSEGFLKSGDLVINIASIPLEDLGNSNMLKLSYVE